MSDDLKPYELYDYGDIPAGIPWPEGPAKAEVRAESVPVTRVTERFHHVREMAPGLRRELVLAPRVARPSLRAVVSNLRNLDPVSICLSKSVGYPLDGASQTDPEISVGPGKEAEQVTYATEVR